MTAAVYFSPNQPGYYLVLLVLALGLFLLYRLGNRRKRASAPRGKYDHLTVEALSAIPDASLVNAIATNILAKEDKWRPAPYKNIPQLSVGRCGVYCVWLMTHELEKDGFAHLFASQSAPFSTLAESGFLLVGAEKCAAVFRDAAALKKDYAKHTDALDALYTQYTAAAAEEQPLQRCVTYIRENPAEFVDEPPSQEQVDESQQ